MRLLVHTVGMPHLHNYASFQAFHIALVDTLPPSSPIPHRVYSAESFVVSHRMSTVQKQVMAIIILVSQFVLTVGR